ncbi:ATP-binding protein [Nocardioides pacificus]
MGGRAGGSASRQRVRTAGLGMAWVAAFTVAGLLGRLTSIDGSNLALVWPAAGVAALWVGAQRGKRVWLHLALLALASYVVNAATGAASDAALLLAGTNTLQTGVYVALARRWLPGTRGFGGTEPFTQLAQLGRLTLAATVGCTLAALVAQGGLLLLGEIDRVRPIDLVVWLARNDLGLLFVVTWGLLGQQSWLDRRRHRDARDPTSAEDGRSRRAVDAVILAAGAAALHVGVFLVPDGEAFAFLLLAPMVWAGIRFSALTVMSYGLLTGAVAVGFTLAGEGPFVFPGDPHFEALLAQVFIGMTVLVGLALAFAKADRAQAHLRLQETQRHTADQEQLLATILDQMHDGVVVVDADLSIVIRNRSASDLFGLTGSPLATPLTAAAVDLREMDGVTPADEGAAASVALRGEVFEPREYRLSRPGFEADHVLEVAAYPVPAIGSPHPRAMIHLRDVTAERLRHQALDEFARVVAHDLRNPVTLIQGWAETLDLELARGVVDPAVLRPMLARVLNGSDHMARLISDLLRLATARDQVLQPHDVDLTRLVHEVASLRTAGPRGATVEVDDDLRAWGDEALLRQLLDNLIGNAIKYTVAHVRPRIEVRRRAVGTTWLEVDVSDNGIGIAPDELERIFEPFHRTRGGQERASGHGLGLAICTEIVQRHRGSITASSGQEGDGTTITLRLPRNVEGFEQP